MSLKMCSKPIHYVNLVDICFMYKKFDHFIEKDEKLSGWKDNWRGEFWESKNWHSYKNKPKSSNKVYQQMLTIKRRKKTNLPINPNLKKNTAFESNITLSGS